MGAVKAAIGYVKAHWVTVLALLTILWSINKPYIDSFVVHHPESAVVYANIAAVVTFYLKSPIGPSNAAQS